MAINRSKIGEAFVRVSADNTALHKGLRMSRKMFGDLGGSLQNVGRASVGVGMKMAQAVGVAALPFGLAIRSGMQFQDVMSEVGAVTQSSAEQLKALTDQAKLLGRTTSFTATEVGSGQAELGRAGFNPEEIQAAIPHVLDLARATKTELAMAAGIAAASMRQFGMEASETQRISDALTTTANQSFTTLESIGESLKYAGPVADDFNMSIEETLALVGALGNVGIQGSSAGTALRRLLTISGAESEKLKEIFGVDFTNDGNARKLIESLAEVNEVTKDLGTSDRSKKFNEAFGLLGITGASALGKNVADVNSLFAALQAGEGAARTTAAAMDDNLGGAWRMMMSAVEGVAIAVTEAATPALRSMFDTIQSVASGITEFVENNKQLVVQFLAGVAAVAALATGFIAGGLAITATGLALSGVAGIIAAIMSPIGIIAALITGIGVASLAARVDADAAFSGIQAKLDGLASMAASAGQGIRDALAAGDWSLAGEIAMEALKIAIKRGLIAIGEMVASFGSAIGEAIMGALTGDFSGVSRLFSMIDAGIDDLVQADDRLDALVKKAAQKKSNKEALAELMAGGRDAGTAKPKSKEEALAELMAGGRDADTQPADLPPAGLPLAAETPAASSPFSSIGGFDSRAFMHQFAAIAPEDFRPLSAFDSKFAGGAANDPSLTIQKTMAKGIERLVAIEENKEPLVYGAD